MKFVSAVREQRTVAGSEIQFPAVDFREHHQQVCRGGLLALCEALRFRQNNIVGKVRDAIG